MANVSLLYTVEDLIEIFKIAESTAWKWLREGRFGEPVRISRRTYVRASVVHKITGGAA